MNVHLCKVTLYTMQFCHMRFVHTTGGCVSLCVRSVWCSEVCTSRAVRCLSLSLWGVEEQNGMREDRSPQSVRGTGEWQLSVPEAAPLPTDGAVQWMVWIVYNGQEPIQSPWLCYRYQVVQDLYQQQSLPPSPVWPRVLHSWVCPTSTWLHTWGCSLSLVEDLQQLPSDDEGRQSSKE